MLDHSEFSFVVERKKMIRNVFSDWESVISLLFHFQINRIDSKKLLLGIEMVLFLNWFKLDYTKDHPSVTIILSFESNPYSINILYYTTGLILQRLSKTKIEKASSNYFFLEFATSNTILLEDIEIASLPTSTFEHRQLVKLFCSNKSF